ncbi:RICIN domain-containing protein [Nonomuraea sp. NPDC026600]|uniref:RICIN domain-containing protein n=1 Tax=Nonomuraea sp. NPDC026600 TaxID=3155363 RepID=UPI0033D729A9
MAMAATAAQAADFPFTAIRSNAIVTPARCIGPFNGGTADGTSIVLMDCGQRWHGFAPVASTTDNSIRHSSGKCLSLANTQNPAPVGTRLVLRSCVNFAAGDQQWTFVALQPGAPDGVWFLRQHSGFSCVGPANGSTAFGTQLVTQSCALGPTQQWLLEGWPGSFGFSYDDGTTP